MSFGLESVINQIDIFLLILIRVTSFFILSPIFSRNSLPSIMKIGLGMLIAVMITSTTSITIVPYDHMIQYMFLILSEFMSGLILGYVAYFAFMALYIAGQIIDMQIGFGMVNVLDPQGSTQIPVTANLYNVLAILLFLSINGHHMLISAIFYSFKVLPIGYINISERFINNLFSMVGDSFVLGFKIAAPIIIAILLVNIALGILARTVPQMNVFVVGMPLKIFVGLLILLLTVPLLSYIMDSIRDSIFNNINFVLKDMI
jgi:flagellar biosynthetic protein FliR